MNLEKAQRIPINEGNKIYEGPKGSKSSGGWSWTIASFHHQIFDKRARGQINCITQNLQGLIFLEVQ